VTQAYFAPNDEFIEVIKDAAGRGVDVRIILPGFSDSSFVLRASRANYEGLLAVGIKLFEKHDRFLHAKTAVIDGLWSTVGSSNLDYLSFVHTNEANAMILGSEFGHQMETQFLEDIKLATPIDAREWNQRSMWQRTKEIFSSYFEYWL
jgi:cardiolipin synthase A/B